MAKKDLIRKNVIHVSKKTRRKERKERVAKKSQERGKNEGEINFFVFTIETWTWMSWRSLYCGQTRLKLVFTAP